MYNLPFIRMLMLIDNILYYIIIEGLFLMMYYNLNSCRTGQIILPIAAIL